MKYALYTEAPYVKVTAPSIDSIAGDKLTAFAPTTIGIPMGKNKSVEIAKQLFDLNLLFEKIESHEIVCQSFENTALMCIKHYKKNFSIDEIYQDIINTCFVMAMMGRRNPNLFNEIKSGMSSLSHYLNKKSNFGYDKALTAAARIAYLAASLMKGKNPVRLNWKSVEPDAFRSKKIEHTEYGVLNKALKAGYSEAWYYWLHTSVILNMQREVKEKVKIKVNGK